MSSVAAYACGAAAACLGALALLAALDRDRAFALVWGALRRHSHGASETCP